MSAPSKLVTAEEMPWERSPDGLIKHLVHRRLNTRECCVEAYMQFLKAGERSGKHRHMWEEVVFVVEGSGYDLHWDMRFECLESFKWEWAEVPKKFEWKQLAAGFRLLLSADRAFKTSTPNPEGYFDVMLWKLIG